MTALKTNLKDYLLINEAAAFIGVSVGTLRNWSRESKLPTHRHPINRYRLYKRADLGRLLAVTKASAGVLWEVERAHAVDGGVAHVLRKDSRRRLP